MATLTIAVGCTSGRVMFLDALTLGDTKQTPFDFAKGIVERITFSPESTYCAYVVSLFFTRKRAKLCIKLLSFLSYIISNYFLFSYISWCSQYLNWCRNVVKIKMMIHAHIWIRFLHQRQALLNLTDIWKDSEHSTTLLRRQKTCDEHDYKWLFSGRHRSHGGRIVDVLFKTFSSNPTPRLFTLGEDRMLVCFMLLRWTMINYDITQGL